MRVDELEVIRTPVNKETAPDGWLSVQYDLTRWATEEVRIQVVHQATGWQHEEAYWGQVQLESK